MDKQSLLETFHGYLAAVKTRNIDALKTYLTQDGTLPFVDGGGTLRLSIADYLKAQEDWFADENWTYQSEIVSCQEYDNTGIIIDRTEIHNSTDGHDSVFRMMVTYIFRKEDEQWRMVTDVCSAIAGE